MPAYLVSNPSFRVLDNNDTWTVTSADTLDDDIAANDPAAVVIHKEMVNLLEGDWWKQQLRAGRIVATIDVEPDKARALVNLPPSGYKAPPFIESPYRIYRYGRDGSSGSGVLSVKDFDRFAQYVSGL